MNTNIVEEKLIGRTVTLQTAKRNGIEPMVDVVSDDGKWITYRGTFGGTKLKRSLRSRVSKVLSSAFQL